MKVRREGDELSEKTLITNQGADAKTRRRTSRYGLHLEGARTVFSRIARLPTESVSAQTGLQADGHRQPVSSRRDHKTLEVLVDKNLAAYAGTAIVMVLLDLFWLGGLAKPMYQQGIGHLMADKPIVGVAVLFYLLYALGVVIFAVAPQHDGTNWPVTLGMGALFGFFAYATYNLTNLATLRDWPVRLSLIDMSWGTFVSAMSAAGGKAAFDWATRTSS